jgi:hypothetical protein
MRGRGDVGEQATTPAPRLRASARGVVRGLARGEETAMTMRGRRDETRGRRRGGDDTRPTKHPQPLPPAIACGVERGATSVYGHGGGMEGTRGGDRVEGKVLIFTTSVHTFKK